MSKAELKTEENASPAIAVILYGVSDIGKPRAGVFKGPDALTARKAGAKLGLQALEVQPGQARNLLTKLPAGRLAATGQSVAPFVRKELYELVLAHASPDPSALQSIQPSRRRPQAWDDVKVGDVVLAQDDDPADGWWECVVVEKAGDILKLRWPRGSKGRPFQRHRNIVGLMYPGDTSSKAEVGKKKPRSLYPADWSKITAGKIVLAKEDGPCEQWWEAKVIEQDKDIFVLQWASHAALPAIRRSRHSLGLMHPAPKSR